MRKILTFLLLGAVLNNGCKCKKDDPVTPIPPVVTEDPVMGKVTHNGSVSGSISSGDGDILAYGYDASDSAVVMKISMTTGAIMWSKRIPSADAVYVNGITELSSGLILVSGNEKVNSLGKAAVIAYNANGERKWRKLYGDDRIVFTTDILSMKNGKVMLTASRSATNTQYELSRFVLDADGNELSRKDMPYNTYTVYNNLSRGSDNSIVQMGTIINTNGNYSLHVIKMDETGEIVAQQEISKPGVSLSGNSIRGMGTGELICCGSEKGSTGAIKGFVMRLTSSLSEAGYKLFSDNAANVSFTEVLPGGEGYTAVGGKINTTTGKRTSYLVTCKSNDEVIREKNYTPTDNRDERLENVWPKNGNFVVLGASNTTDNGKYFLMGLDKNGDPK